MGELYAVLGTESGLAVFKASDLLHCLSNLFFFLDFRIFSTIGNFRISAHTYLWLDYFHDQKLINRGWGSDTSSKASALPALA